MKTPTATTITRPRTRLPTSSPPYAAASPAPMQMNTPRMTAITRARARPGLHARPTAGLGSPSKKAITLASRALHRAQGLRHPRCSPARGSSSRGGGRKQVLDQVLTAIDESMPSDGPGVAQYMTVEERLAAGMVADNRWRDRIAVDPWKQEVFTGNRLWWRLKTLRVGWDAWVWAGWPQRAEPEDRSVMTAALGLPAENALVPLSTSEQRWAVWRAQAGTVISLVEQVGPPEVLLPANQLGWILWCDPDQDHIDLFIEHGADCNQ